MKVDINKLIELNVIHIPNMGALMYPDIPKHQAGVKLRNKIKRIKYQKLTDADWALIEIILTDNQQVM